MQEAPVSESVLRNIRYLETYFPCLKTNPVHMLNRKWCDNILFISGYNRFSEICASSKVSNPFPTVNLFLVVYKDTLKWKTIAESVVTNGAEKEFFEKSTKHWVGSALAADLEVLKVLSAANGSFSWTMVPDVRKAVLIVQLEPYNFFYLT